MNWTRFCRTLGILLALMYGLVFIAILSTDTEYRFDSSDISFLIMSLGVSLIVGTFKVKSK